MRISVFVVLAMLAGLVFAPGCGRSTAAPAPSNTLPITVSSGPPGADYLNGLFTSITLCVPGTTDCQTLDSVLVDTGSSGLRVLSSSEMGKLSLVLPPQKDGSGDPIVECNAFEDGYTWGPLQLADIAMGDEKALSVPIQVIGDPTFATVPTSCSASGGPSENSLAELGTYAILGVGPYPQDCGGPCADSPTGAQTENPGNVYYTCPSSGCQPAAVAVEAQVQNPVSLFPVDNNGVVIDLPPVSASGAASLGGTLVFGIGTAANNDLGGATVLPIDATTLSFTTQYLGQSYPESFIDSGSNALYFLDSKATSLPTCKDNSFYCPDGATPVTFTATNEGINGAESAVDFSVANTDTLLENESLFAFDDLAGSSTGGQYFDWGVPFFFGRKVFSAIAGTAAPGGQTPYFAY